MLAMFRRFLNTWAARAFFIVLIASFGLWGVSGVVHDTVSDNAVAHVGDRRIEAGAFQEQYRRALAEVSRMLGGRVQPTPAISRAVAGQTLERMVADAAVDEQAAALGIVIPLDEVKRTIRAIPAFAGPGGAFDLSRYNGLLRANDLTEARFVEQVRAGLAQGQLMDAVASGAAPPDVLVRAVFALQRETRVVDTVELAFAAAPEPPAPTAEDLQRQYDNNLPHYSTPEYRRIKALLLSPDTVARPDEVPDADVQAYWDAHQAELNVPERRSVRILVAADEAKAASLAAALSSGTSWDDVQKQAADGATAIAFDDALPSEIPVPDLAAAIFAAVPDTVVGPLASPLGWRVFQVVKVTAGRSTTLADATPGIRAGIARERATDSIYDRVNLLEDAVAASPTLDEIPTETGAAVAAGTLDAAGNTAAGEPAPLPGTPAQRQAILTAAFALAKGEPPRLSEGPDGSHFAVLVEDVTAATPRPFADVEAQVREDWLHDARRRSQEVVAAKLLTAAQAGNLDDAATVAGLRVEHSVPLTRGAPPAGTSRELAEAAFRLKPHETTMVETPDAFLVLSPGASTVPDMASDPIGAGLIRKQLTEGMGQDLQALYAAAIRTRLRPTVNQRVLDSIVQPPS